MVSRPLRPTPSLRKKVPYRGPEEPPTFATSVMPQRLRMSAGGMPISPGSSAATAEKPRDILMP